MKFRRKISVREKKILVAAAGALAVIVLFNIGAAGARKLTHLDKNIKDKVILLQSYFNLVDKKEDIRSFYTRYKDIFTSGIEADKMETELFNEVNNSARNCGVTIERIQPLPLRVNKEHREAVLEVELEGGLSSIFSFINQLENSPFFIRILSLRLYSQSSGSASLRCRTTVSRLFF